MPARQRAGGDEQASATGCGQQSGQRAEQGTVCPARPRTADLPTQDVHLVAQHQDLRILRLGAAGQQSEPGHQLPEDEIRKAVALSRPSIA
ncbi:MAG: hypothetical protein LC808_23435 [Actinobacteria bacterium]|nr:hypothetical protein [Actinomycetota bacterium]